jgi:hypothetical protein
VPGIFVPRAGLYGRAQGNEFAQEEAEHARDAQPHCGRNGDPGIQSYASYGKRSAGCDGSMAGVSAVTMRLLLPSCPA